MYDFAHPIEDAIEHITHSICTLEFEDHRPLYDWVLREVGYEKPSRQIEFARMNLNYTLTSKRRCLRLVRDNIVSGWDDPRMSTICGMRRRGYTPEAIRDFCDRIGIAKANSVIDFALLEACIREDLNKRAPRAMAVLRPIKLIIDNYPEGQVEQIEVEVNPENPEMGKRTVEFSRELYIEEEDFMEDAPKKYFRLSPGREVRLKGAYYVTCTGCDKDENGNVVAVHCTYDPETRGGDAPDGRKVKGTIHFVSAAHAIDAEVRLYDRLFNVENPSDETGVNDFTDNLNKDSMVVLKNAKLESNLTNLNVGDKFQFLRLGYFCRPRFNTGNAGVQQNGGFERQLEENKQIRAGWLKSPSSPLFAEGSTLVRHLRLQSGNLNDFSSALMEGVIFSYGRIYKIHGGQSKTHERLCNS